MSEPDRKIYICTQLSEYEGFIPDGWPDRILAMTAQGSVLEKKLLDLLLSWRTTGYTASMPAVSIKAMHAAAVGKASFVSPDSSIVSYSDAIICKLSRQVPELVDDRPLRSRITKALVVIADELRNQLALLKDDFPIDLIWEDSIRQPLFQLSLWGSQRVSFVAFYNAYEAFLLDCLEPIRITRKPGMR